MKLPRLTFIFFFLFGALLTGHGDVRTAEERFFEANVLAGEEAYAEAVPLYEAALAKHPSANLHCNLGNAYYHLGDWGKARIHWERALAMEPRHPLARKHLERLLHELNLPNPAPGFWIQVATGLSYNQWVWIGAFSFWVAVFSILIRQWKNIRWLSLPAALGALVFLLMIASILSLNPTRQHAIVLGDQAALRIAPAPGSPVSLPLRPAQRVRVNEAYGEFLRIQLENGQEGFILSDQLEKIR